MPVGVDLDHDHEETRPVNGQRHEPWSEARGGKPAEKRASDARAGGESWLFARYVAEKIAEYEGRGEEPPLAAQEDAEQPGDPHGGGADEASVLPERSPDAAHEPWDAAMSAAAELSDALRALKADFVHWAENERRRRRRWAGLAMAAGFPACVLLGLLVQVQFEVIPLHDPTRGWGEHIWNTYVRTVVDCELEAMRTDMAVECPLAVRP